MPELPEVETVRLGIERCLVGRSLLRITVGQAQLRWPIPVEECAALAGRNCVQASRRAKYLCLHFDGLGAPVAVVHLGMSGRVWIEPTTRLRSDPEWRRHEHWRMDFDGQRVRYVDPRRFGMLDVVPRADLDQHRLLRHLGPEPLGPDFDGDYLFRRSRGRQAATKVFLMDARHVVGIGNIYASEACFGAGIRPRRAAGRLRRRECEALVTAARSVLEKAIERGGTTIRDYVGVHEDAGYFQRELMVYDRAGSPCRRCGAPIKRTVDGGRSTFYCPHCQR